jgi:carboxypeptidase Q
MVVAAVIAELLFCTGASAQEPRACERSSAGGPNAANKSSALIREIQDHQRAVEDIEYLTDVIGPRVTGSPQLVRAHDWVEGRMKAIGAANIKREAYAFGPTFERGRATAKLLSHAKVDLAIAQLAWSPATRGVVRGELFIQRGSTADELAGGIGKFGGKIILASPLRAKNSIDSATLIRVAGEMKREGALAYLRESDKPVGLSMGGSPRWVNPMRPVIPTGILSKEGFALLKRLGARDGPVTLEVNLPGRISSNAVEAFNSAGEIGGFDKANEVVIIAAHLDSWDLATGATDDGTAVVAVIEAIRAIKALEAVPKRSIRAVFFSGEEQGEFGARAYIRRHQQEMSNVQAVLIVDVGGGRVNGWALQRASDETTRLMSCAIDPLRVLGVNELPVDIWAGSDPKPFADVGVPTFAAVQEVDDYFTTTHHSEFDTFSHVKPESLIQMAKALAVTAWELANMEERLPHSNMKGSLSR